MKKTTTTNIEAIIAELAKNHKNMKEQIASVRVTLDAMEAESEKMQSALEKAMIELMKAKADDSKKQPSKLWHITYTYRGVTKELWLARDIYISLNGKYNPEGFVAMVDGIRRGDCIRITQDMVKKCGCPEYQGDSFSYWMDEEAVDYATEWMAMQDQHRRKSPNLAYDADAIVRRYAEIRNGKQVAKEFDLSPAAVGCILRRRGVETPGYGSNRKVTQEMEAEIIRLYKEGLSQAKIARIVGISQKTVCAVLRRNGIGKGLDR